MIYLLEDDDSIRKLVIYALESQGYEAQGFALPSLFWKAMAKEPPELLLLDIMLPEEDGLSVLHKLRAAAATKQLPVILLTAKNTEYDRVIGLDGEPIPHLYEAGTLGHSAAQVYCIFGANLAECLNFGRIAGRNAALEEPLA